MKQALIPHDDLATQFTMSADQLEMCARFLEKHPRFYPELKEVSGLISGFRVGPCFLSVDEMNELIAAEPHFGVHEAGLLLKPLPASDRSLT